MLWQREMIAVCMRTVSMDIEIDGSNSTDFDGKIIGCINGLDVKVGDMAELMITFRFLAWRNVMPFT